MGEIPVYACTYLAKVMPEVIDAFNGDGPAPDAVTVGGARIYFTQPPETLRRHEHDHVVQAAEFAPRWLRWAPLQVRAWIGAPAFWKAYLEEHQKNGYLNNKFEVRARKAENHFI